MWINKNSGKLTVTFGYDPKIVTAVKSITGRKFNSKLKRWEIPLSAVEETLSTLEPLGFSVHLDVKNLVREQREFFARAEEIRKNPSVYGGTLPLYDFQKVGAAWLREMPGALLADVPGLGKTIQTIAALEDIGGPHLIVCPASLKYSWADEIAKWCPDVRVMVIDGKSEERREQWGQVGTHRFVVVNYEVILRDFSLIKDITWSSIVCDEANRIQNSAAKTTRALKTLKTRKKIALSGTPVANSPVDIYSIIDWIVPGYLGDEWTFQEKYCIFSDATEWRQVVGFKNLDKLGSKIAPLMLRRTKEEVLTDFPPKTRENIVFNLSEPEKKAYQAIKLQIFNELQELGIMGTSLSIIVTKILRLKQATDSLRLIADAPKVSHETKIDVLKGLVAPIVASGEKVLVFTQFSDMLKILYSELAVYKPCAIWGETPSKARIEEIKTFIADPERKIMIMTEAGAFGLNLQCATYVVHYDLPWSISKLTQREDRVHRIGQKKPVTVYSLIARDTIDEYINRVLYKKQKASVEILNDFERLEAMGLSKNDINAILNI